MNSRSLDYGGSYGDGEEEFYSTYLDPRCNIADEEEEEEEKKKEEEKEKEEEEKEKEEEEEEEGEEEEDPAYFEEIFLVILQYNRKIVLAAKNKTHLLISKAISRTVTHVRSQDLVHFVGLLYP